MPHPTYFERSLLARRIRQRLSRCRTPQTPTTIAEAISDRNNEPITRQAVRHHLQRLVAHGLAKHESGGYIWIRSEDR